MSTKLEHTDQCSKANAQAIKQKRLVSGSEEGPVAKQAQAIVSCEHSVSSIDSEADGDEEVKTIFVSAKPSLSSEPANDEDDWLDLVDDEDGGEARGPPVTDQLASMLNKRFGKVQPMQRAKSLQSSYPAPANCKLVTAPKVSGEMLHRLNLRENRAMKFCDGHLTKIQHALVRSAGALIQMMNALSLSSRPGAKPLDARCLFKTGLDALSLLGHGNYLLSLRHRESMTGILKYELAPTLCSPDLPVTEYLFGEDGFSQTVKNVKQMAHLGRDVGRKDSWSKNGWTPKGKAHGRQTRPTGSFGTGNALVTRRDQEIRSNQGPSHPLTTTFSLSGEYKYTLC